MTPPISYSTSSENEKINNHQSNLNSLPPTQMSTGTHRIRPFQTRISSKLAKKKSSKVRYLSKEELTGILLSVIVSLLFTFTLCFLSYLALPLVKQFLMDTYEKVLNVIKIDDKLIDNNTKLITYLPLIKKMTKDNFDLKIMNHRPAVWVISDEDPVSLSNNFYQSLLLDYGNTAIDYKLLEEIYSTSNIKSKCRISKKLKEVIATNELKFNRKCETVDRYISDSTIINKLRKLGNLMGNLFSSSDSNDNSTTTEGRIVDGIDSNRTLRTDIVQSLVIGRNNTNLCGSPFHNHNQVWNKLLYGTKHWIIYRPGTLPTSSKSVSQNIMNWLNHSYPSTSNLSMKLRPIEIIQEAGQVVYIPQGWNHATKTISNVSISVKIMSQTISPGDYYYYMADGDSKMQNKQYSAAIRMYKLGLAMQRTEELLLRLADVYQIEKQHSELIEVYSELVDINPTNAGLIAKFVNILIRFSGTESSVMVSELLAKAEASGIRDKVLSMIN